jgi:phage tail sheath gpL-like
MSVDASAVARVLGITTTFKDMRGGKVLYLPQRIAIFAQGQTGTSFSLTKWSLTSAAAAGARYGWRSQINQIVRELLPVNGDGVGTIPITIYPLEDESGSVAAAGDVTPSGTATKSASYRLRIAGILSEAFTVAAGAVNVTTVCKAIYDAVVAVLHMPVTCTFTYGSVTASALTGTGNGTITSLSVTGAPRPGAWTLVLNTVVANGGVWTLTDPDGVVVSETVTMTPGAGGATVINVGGLQFTLTDGSTDFGLGATFTITVPATKVNLTCAWKGLTGNDIVVELDGESSYGVTFAFTQPTGGLVNPSMTDALDQVGNVWETMALNAMNFDDEVTLDAFQTFGEGRWGALVRKPLVVFHGNTLADLTAATAVSDTRTDDYTNVQLVAPGSPNLPCVVAARQLARIVALSNNDPGHDYGSQQATGLVPGTDGVQWDYAQRDLAVKAGSSTIEVRGGVVHISDVVTPYAPDGEEPPAYRFVCDIVKLQNILFNIDLRFAVPEWDGALLIPDDQPTTRASAKKPKMAKAVVGAVIDNLALEALISDPKTSKKNMTAAINGSNPKRLDLVVPVQLSGNTNVKSIDLHFGFFFGTAAVAA